MWWLPQDTMLINLFNLRGVLPLINPEFAVPLQFGHNGQENQDVTTSCSGLSNCIHKKAHRVFSWSQATTEGFKKANKEFPVLCLCTVIVVRPKDVPSTVSHILGRHAPAEVYGEGLMGRNRYVMTPCAVGPCNYHVARCGQLAL